MLHRKLMRRGLARVMALTLAVSMAMPGTALAAAAQPPLEEAAVEEVYEEEAAAAEETADETVDETVDEEVNEAADEEVDETADLTNEGTKAEDPEEKAQADAEAEEAETKDAAPATAEPASQGEPASRETAAEPASQEAAAEPAAASPEMNRVMSVNVDLNDCTRLLGLNGVTTYQFKYEVIYDPSTSYEMNEPVYFKSDDESVVTVDSNGLVTAVGTGYGFVGIYTKPTEDDGWYEEERLWAGSGFNVYENMYSVKFDLNGGTIADGLETENEDACKTIIYGGGGNEDQYIWLPTSFYKDTAFWPAVVREGYVFNCWTETKDGEDEVSIQYYPSKNTTLYAKWRKLCDVKFDLNGGTLADGLEEADEHIYKMYTDGITVTEGDGFFLEYEFLKDSEYKDVLVRDGYRFIGWTETKDGGKVVNNGYKPTKDITLYAKWAKAHSVKFDLNGGRLADGLEEADASEYRKYTEGTTVVDGEVVNLYMHFWDGSDYHIVAERDGYRFDGWTDIRDGSTVYDGAYTPSKDTTLYAKWTKTYTVTFDVNSGTWTNDYYRRMYGNGYPVDQNDRRIYLPESDALTRSGYTLAGWTTTKDGTSVLTGKYDVTEDITLYAKWVKYCKVTLNAGEGYFGSNTSAKTKVIQVAEGRDIGSYLVSSSNPRGGSRVFLGWYKDAGLKTPVKKSDTVTGNITLYAKYEAKTYKITVTNLKGASYTKRGTNEYISGSGSTAESYDFYISQGDEIGGLDAHKNSVSAQFFFDQECKTRPFYNDYVPTGDTTVYAKWDTEITISWDGDDGRTYEGVWQGSVTCKKDQMCTTLPAQLIKGGYYFVGWYDAADSSQKILPASHVFTKDTTVKAKWATGIKITFEPNGGTINSYGPSVIYIKPKTSVGEQMRFSAYREGYTFTGWKNSSGEAVNLNDEKPDKATTYTAVWKKNAASTTTVNVTLTAGDGSIYSYENDGFVSKLVVKVPKGSTLGDADFNNSVHDEPSKKLYFAGWSTSENGEALKSSYEFTKDVKLYPVWQNSAAGLSVALVTNGGAIDNRPSNSPRVYNVAKDATIKLPNASNMEKEGYTFVGWYTDPSFTTKVATPDAYKVTKSCYLYANWKEGEPSEPALGKTTRGDMFNLANNVKVTWKEVPGAKYYKVYREGVTNKSETQKEPVIVTTGLVGWDSQPGLTNGHAYRYKIVASTTGKGDPSGDSKLSYSKLMYRLKTVVIRSVKNTAPGKVTVKYDKTATGDSYVLQYCERQDMVGAKTKVVLGASNTSYVIGGLKKGKTYYISIRVRKKVNGIDYYTTFGVAKKVTITK